MVDNQRRSDSHRRRLGALTAPSLYLNGTTALIYVVQNATINDKMANGGTVEGWFKIAPDCPTGGYLICKHQGGVHAGWRLGMVGTTLLVFHVEHDVGDLYISFGNPERDTWLHLAGTYDAAAKSGKSFINGQQISSDTATGNYNVDGTRALIFGRLSVAANSYYKGNIGWIRWSDSIRYSSNFSPPSRYQAPAVDGNTLEQWNLDEGQGTTVAAQVNVPTNDATAANCEWQQD